MPGKISAMTEPQDRFVKVAQLCPDGDTHTDVARLLRYKFEITP
jgi:hypothetical protein